MLLFRNRLSTLIYSKRLFSVHQLIYQEYGNPTEVLKFCEKEFDADKLEKNQVHIKWLASPINPADLNQIQGVYPVKPTLPAVGGNEGCAKIIKIGSEVIGLKNDDLVIPSIAGIGTWSTCGIYESKDFFKINADPKDFIFLSMLQVNPSTAYRMLKDFVKLSPGDIIVQNGANSAVGHFVIQICRILGVKSINVVRDRPEIYQLKKQLEEVGADEVYTEKEFLGLIISKRIKAKLALNCVGGTSGMNLSRSLEYGGTMVTYGGMSKSPVQTATSSLIFANTKSVGFWMSKWYGLMQNKKEREHMYKELINWYKNGNLTLPKYEKRGFSDYKKAIEKSIQNDDSNLKIKPKQIFTTI